MKLQTCRLPTIPKFNRHDILYAYLIQEINFSKKAWDKKQVCWAWNKLSHFNVKDFDVWSLVWTLLASVGVLIVLGHSAFKGQKSIWYYWPRTPMGPEVPRRTCPVSPTKEQGFTMSFFRLPICFFLLVVILNDRRSNDFHRNIKHRMTMPSGWVNSKWKLPHMLYRGIIPVLW